MTKNAIINVPLKSVVPDENQPRKNFDPERLGELINSIKKHGIISPLQVQDIGGGKYLLEDGERRWRAATELGLEEVPVVVQNKTNDVDRLIRQFHLQEQHEGWSPVEKATAVTRLSESMKTSVKQMAELLSLPERTVSDYESFASLLERKQFEKTEIPLHFATSIVNARRFVKGQFEKRELEFDIEKQKELELALITRIKTGDIKKHGDINKIRDSAKMNPALILKFIKDSRMTTQRLYLDAEAKVAHHYRNMVYAARMIDLHWRAGEPLKSYNLLDSTGADAAVLKRAKEAIEEMLLKA